MDYLKIEKIAIIGLGYVGLPLAVEFGRKFPTIGFDIDKIRIKELNYGYDHTLEIAESKLKETFNQGFFSVSSNMDSIKDSNIYIVTVPTLTDKHNKPDLSALYGASEMIGEILKKGNLVIYESTVYPGATEDECVPILERVSGLKINEDFYVGYSPERTNPGDKEHTITKTLKITSGSTPEVADFVNNLYRSIITAGTYKTTSIKVAEAAKVIENSQRDINIAFVNELAKIFNKLGIDTHEVLNAAGSKWNFLKFKPGLVGGRCIGTGSYYLAQKAEEVGYHPEIILVGRRMNNSMGAYVANQVVKLMTKKNLEIKGAKVLIMGITFKENCTDIENTKVIDVIREFQDYSLKVDVFDPWANREKVKQKFGLELQANVEGKYDAIVLTVGHDKFKKIDLTKVCSEGGVLYDMKGILDKDKIDNRL